MAGLSVAYVLSYISADARMPAPILSAAAGSRGNSETIAVVAWLRSRDSGEESHRLLGTGSTGIYAAVIMSFQTAAGNTNAVPARMMINGMGKSSPTNPEASE